MSKQSTNQLSYEAVFSYIRRLGDVMPNDTVHRNALIWRGVEAALGALPERDESDEAQGGAR
ncbi:hypothetical protein ADL27_38475 [Streptomyces sp. NRRL F-6602]|nr:hypothetical protein ADL27_38475 [Streptomyces sp. NRRL F-6602]